LNKFITSLETYGPYEDVSAQSPKL